MLIMLVLITSKRTTLIIVRFVLRYLDHNLRIILKQDLHGSILLDL